MEREELAQLTRELRRRVEQSHESEWAAATTVMTRPEREMRTEPAVAAPRGSDKAAKLAVIAGRIKGCQACALGSTRLNAVPGVGSPDARVMFIGEGPGFEEDHKGEPFVGKSGQLLDKILESIGLSRQTVYIANVVKCHPMKNAADPEARGNDRPPEPAELSACRPFLDEQIGVIAPAIIVTLGAVAAKALLGEGISITRIRGQWRQYTPAGGAPVKLLPTFHPAALLRDPNLKKDVWTDMKNLKKELESK